MYPHPLTKLCRKGDVILPQQILNEIASRIDGTSAQHWVHPMNMISSRAKLFSEAQTGGSAIDRPMMNSEVCALPYRTTGGRKRS